MREITGNIWHYHINGEWVVIPTNGDIRKDGKAVMGRGLALDAAQKWPALPHHLAQCLKVYGNIVFGFPNSIARNCNYRIFTFPTKRHWHEQANLALIEQSAALLAGEVLLRHLNGPIYLPRVGCGEGGLIWGNVRPVLDKYFDDKFVVLSPGMSRREIVRALTMQKKISRENILNAWIDGAYSAKSEATFAVIVKWKGATLYRTVGNLDDSHASSNCAEYAALIHLLKWAQDKEPLAPLVIHSDSQMLVHQMNEAWGLKNGAYVPYAKEAIKLKQHHKAPIKIVWIPREENTEADALSKCL